MFLSRQPKDRMIRKLGRFVEFSDMANVRECLEHTKEADLCLTLGQDGGYRVEGR